MSKYIVDIDDFEPMFKVDSIGVFGIGKSVTDNTENHSWSRIKSLVDFEELNSDYINEHFGDLQDTAYKKGFEDGKWKSEDGCTGCQYEGKVVTGPPCITCCNSYRNHWTAKDDEIKVENERMKAKRVMHEDCTFLYWTCSKCNSLVLEHDNFCSNCGADFRRNEDGEEKNNDEN